MSYHGSIPTASQEMRAQAQRTGRDRRQLLDTWRALDGAESTRVDLDDEG